MKINILPSLINQMNVISSEYDIEIAGYITGEIKNGEIFLQELLIPKQITNSVRNMITSEHQVNLLKKYGKKCQKIIGHWHSHHNMGVFWSEQDIELQNNTMERKKLFVFVVSSLGKHLITIRMKDPLKLEIDNAQFHIKNRRLDELRNKVNRIIKNNRDFDIEKHIEKDEEINKEEEVKDDDETQNSASYSCDENQSSASYC